MTTKPKAEDFEQLERLHSSFVDQFMQYLPDNIFAKMNDAAIILQDASYELGRQRGLKDAGAAAEEFRISSDIQQANRELAERQRDELAAQLAELEGQEPVATSQQVVPEGFAIVPAYDSSDAIVSALYRRFKEWSARGFGPEDVTWCEVRADVLALLAAATQPVAKESE